MSCSSTLLAESRVGISALSFSIHASYRRHNLEDEGMILLNRFLAAAFAVLVCGPIQAHEPLYPGLGSYARKVTTKSPLAQRYFNQGLALCTALIIPPLFVRSRKQPRSSNCAMAHWGIALAAGPHINYPLVPPPMADLAWKELTLAQEHADKASPVERALIEALSHRYANPQPQDRTPLDHAYADAMREVWKQYPKDPDVGAFFAESMMDLRPWNQWTLEGQPNPGTEEIIATLDAVLKLKPNHPFANHLYIHAVEASPHPERADGAADRLRQLQPGLAHNVHMPSHIDIRRGRWQQVIITNAKAVEADKRYRKISATDRSASSHFTPRTITCCLCRGHDWQASSPCNTCATW
jgi:hypothetical protein